MTITALIPIKMESLRVPGKNTRMLGNRPLCQYIFQTLLRVKNAGYIDRICVYCSNPTIKEYLLPDIEYIQRPISLDGHEVEGLTIYREIQKTVKSDWYLLCHTTSPFLHADTIIDSITKVVRSPQSAPHSPQSSLQSPSQSPPQSSPQPPPSQPYDSAMTVARLQTFAWFDGKPLNYYPQRSIPRTQTLHPVYWETSGLYLFSSTLLDSTPPTRIGKNPYLVVVEGRERIDIDNIEDWDLAEAYLQAKSSQ